MISISPDKIFSIQTKDNFEQAALAIFQYQATENAIYSAFLNTLKVDPFKITTTLDIPFLPIDFFKSQTVKCGNAEPEIVFSSSGTTGMINSKHTVADVSIYIQSFRQGFRHFYGNVEDYAVLALLPSYLEREGSSLIFMVDDLIKESKNPASGYFLYNHAQLRAALESLRSAAQKTILIGVTYALLDFVESFPTDFPGLIVMETGGMKGKRREMIREELHATLTKGFGVDKIHSEYGMTELLSQGYSNGDGIFQTPPWMKILIRDINDPLTLLESGKTGGINVIDLANLHSCAFIATQDLGRLNANETFEILGRFDNSDIRGCNLLVQ